MFGIIGHNICMHVYRYGAGVGNPFGYFFMINIDPASWDKKIWVRTHSFA